MKRYLLSLLVGAGVLFITCGNEPPEGFYNGTPQDDSLIQAQLDAHPEFLNTVDQFVENYIPFTMPSVDFPGVDSYFRVDSPLVKQHIDSCALSISDSSRFADFWYAKDTTCTVYLWDTFSVISKMHEDIRYVGHYDSVIIDPGTGETLAMKLKTMDTIINPGPGTAYQTKNIVGEGTRLIFLEPKRDSVNNLIEPREWVLKRVSYGIYYFPNRGGVVASIYNVVFYNENLGISDTVWYSSYDTTYTGHAMNRLRAVDSLLTYPANETLFARVSISPAELQNDYFYFVSLGGQKRVQLVDGTGSFVITGQGIENLYIEAVAKDSYYYVTPNKGYSAVVWLIPVRVE